MVEELKYCRMTQKGIRTRFSVVEELPVMSLLSRQRQILNGKFRSQKENVFCHWMFQKISILREITGVAVTSPVEKKCNNCN